VSKRAWVSAAVVAALACALLGSASSGAAGPAKKTVHVSVADDYFSPTTVKIKSGSKVSYDWSGANLDSHNVHLKKGPRKVSKKDFRSATGTIGIHFAPKFKVPGKYHFVCTLHSSVMTMDVTVKK
jgi:plastocyanin